MTEEMIVLRALLEKSSDADLLREMIGFTAQRLMELEVTGLIGAPPWPPDTAGQPCRRAWRDRPSYTTPRGTIR